jgi:MFS transporter, ACS family, glucarate transporter
MNRSLRAVTLVCLVCCVAYLVRTDIAVAQERMAPELGLRMTDMGLITAWAFQLSYALLQMPAGMFGERVGARTALTLALLGCAVASLVTGIMPAAGATGTLIGTRILLGVSQAAVFPVAAMAVSQYVEADRRVRATAFFIAASSLGGALAPLMMAPVMERFGWRSVFLVSSACAGIAAVSWRVLMPSPPVTDTPKQTAGALRAGAVLLLRDRNLQRLSLAYLLHSAVFFVFVFWFFRYLTEGRGFSVLASGNWASLPNMAGVVLAPLIGMFADRLGRRIGSPRARRRVAMGCLSGATALALTGAVVPSAVLAIAALSLSSGCLNGAEAPFFTTATSLGASQPGAAAGLLNLMGNLGGVLSIWLVPQMSAAWGWNGTLAFWAGVAAVAALLWLTVDEPSWGQSPMARG